MSTQRAIILGCAGPRLSPAEAVFFRNADPLGFILFARNCETPDQVRELVAGLRNAVGRADAPVLIDQEGGRVARLGPPHWRAAPAPARFGEIFQRDAGRAREAVRLNARLMAAELSGLGIDVDCAPVLDLRFPGASDIVGDRSFSDQPDIVTELGAEVCGGLLEGGVLPVIKHLPGHGRAAVDSHMDLPLIETGREELEASDFAPFKRLSGMPLGMTGHLAFSAIDPDLPTTLSPSFIDEIIRGHMGFDGLLMSDDLSMEALSGTIGERAKRALAAGCDIALHCNGKLEEMRDVAAESQEMTSAAARRWQTAAAGRVAPTDNFDSAEAVARLDALMGDAA